MSNTQARLDAYRAAELSVLKGQSVRLGERQLNRADLAEIRAGIAQLESQLQRETEAAAGRGGLRYSTAVFCRR
jgi:hypothetical protein